MIENRDRDVIGQVLDCLSIPKKTVTDSVNSPLHYKEGGIETIDMIEAKLSLEEFKGYLKGNVFKYLSRAKHKGFEAEDYEKAQWYLNRLVNGKKL
jgi:hypothetical protein